MRCWLLLHLLYKGACGIEGGWKHGAVDPEPIATGGAFQMGKSDGFPDA